METMELASLAACAALALPCTLGTILSMTRKDLIMVYNLHYTLMSIAVLFAFMGYAFSLEYWYAVLVMTSSWSVFNITYRLIIYTKVENSISFRKFIRV